MLEELFVIIVFILEFTFQLFCRDQVGDANVSHMELIQHAMQAQGLIPTSLGGIAKASFNLLASLTVFRKGHKDGFILNFILGATACVAK
jgi:hypothetical protein